MRGDSTKANVNITLDFSTMLNTFVNQMLNGINTVSLLEFANEIVDMFQNQKSELGELENALNYLLGRFLPQGRKIYVNSKSHIRIGYAPNN